MDGPDGSALDMSGIQLQTAGADPSPPRNRMVMVAIAVAVLAAGVVVSSAVTFRQPPTIALVTPVPRHVDLADSPGYVWRGWDLARSRADFRAEEPDPRRNLVGTLRELAESGVDLVLMDRFSFGADLPAEFPDTIWVTVGADLSGTTAADHTLVGVLYGEMGYLAGVAAASTTETGIVGYMGGGWPPFPLDEGSFAAFEEGVRSVDSGVVVVRRDVVGEFGGRSPSEHARRTEATLEDLYSRDADVVYAAVPGLSMGVWDVPIRISVETGVRRWVIGSDSSPAVGLTPSQASHVLASTFVRADELVVRAIEEFLAGDLEPGVTTVGVADDAIGIIGDSPGFASIEPALAVSRDALAARDVTLPTSSTNQPLPPIGFEIEAEARVTVTVSGDCALEWSGPSRPRADVAIEVINEGAAEAHVRWSLGAGVAVPAEGTIIWWAEAPTGGVTLDCQPHWRDDVTPQVLTEVGAVFDLEQMFPMGDNSGVRSRFRDPDWIS